MFDNNKLFGVGFKNFRHESFHRQVNLGENIAVTTHPHQIHLDFFIRVGNRRLYDYYFFFNLHNF